MEFTGRPRTGAFGRRGLAPVLTLIAAAAALSMLAVAPASAARNSVGGGAGFSIRKATTEVSATPSATTPHWACPTGVCDAIVDPPPVKLSSGYALPQNGPLLEGSGEGGGYDPADLRSAYKFPTSGGSTQTIALVDAFGYAAAESDLTEYRKRYGLPACTKASGCFKRLNQKGEEANYPKEGGAEEKGWQVESALDLDMASAACPSCKIMLVEAENPSLKPDNLAISVNTAVTAGATEVSNSYGAPEEYCALLEGECTNVAPDYSHAGVVITASAGDEGYNNFYSSNASPSYPATLASVIAVGGTFLHKAANARGWSESVWNEPGRKLGTGSGCSAIQTKPSWQTDKACTHRIDNDIAAVGGCATPVSVYIAAEGKWLDVCGTSASSPLVAGIMALASESIRSAGARAFYENPKSLFDVTEGSNGTCTPAEDEYFCTAKIGYDGPTGLGTPDEIPGAPGTTPTVTKVEPNAGPLAGGTSVTITGTNLTGATAVKFGATNATSFKVNSATSISSVSPVGSGTVEVTVTTPEGTSPANPPGDSFAYVAAPTVTKLKPTSGPEAGGTTVTVTGTNFIGVTAVKFGTLAAKGFKVNSATSITAEAPEEAIGTVDVTVVAAGGTSAISSNDHYKFSPTISSLSPNSGPAAGGTSVTVQGTGFALGKTATAFKFGTTKAASVNCTSSTQCTVVSPAHATGKVEVKATVNKVSSLKTSAATFTYV
jgi:IPT/TIG domain